VAAAGVNFIEIYQREGLYPRPTPFGLGVECAGRVTAVGAGVAELAVGDLIATSHALGGAIASAALVPADKAILVPAGVTPELAAASMLQGMTAHYLLTSTYAVTAGDEVLIHAAAGGVGQLLVQLAKARGAHVIAAVGSAEKIVHVAYDGVGKATFDASLASLRRRGMMALFGAASGAVPPVDPQRLNSGGSLFLTRPTLNDYTADRAELVWRAGEVLAAIADGSLRVAIGGRYPLDRAAQAYADLASRGTSGKLLIVP